MFNQRQSQQDEGASALPEAPSTALIRELDTIPDLDDPDFDRNFLIYRMGIQGEAPESEPMQMVPDGSFVVLPSDSLTFIELKESCRHYIGQMQGALNSTTHVVSQLERGEHPLQLKIQELESLSIEQQGGELASKIEGKLNSLRKGLDAYTNTSTERLEWLRDQFGAYQDKELFHQLGQKELERQISVRDRVLLQQVEQAAEIKSGSLPPKTPLPVENVLPALNVQFFRLYLATQHSSESVSSWVSVDPTPFDDYKYEQADSYREGYRELKQVTLNGSPKVGTVEFIRQIHDVPGQLESDIQITSYSQEKILRHLTETGVKVVFREGGTFDIHASSPSRTEDLRTVEVREAFSNGLPDGDLTTEQRRLLTTIGAPEIYAVLNPEVSLLATADLEFEKSRRFIQGTRPDLAEACIIPLREQAAMDKITDYLALNPGEKVALVYGAAHHFNATSLGVSEESLEKMPHVVSIEWPALHLDMMSEYSSAKRESIRSAKNKELKHLLALNAEELTVEAFSSLNDPQLQLTLLPKLVPDFTRHTSAADLARDILGQLPIDEAYDELRSSIRKRSRTLDDDPTTLKPPFSALAPKQYNWDAVAEAPSFRIDETVLAEQHYPTRYELVRKASALSYQSLYAIAAPSLQQEVLSKVVMHGSEGEIFDSLASVARSGQVLDELQQHRQQMTGPFFSCRFSGSSPLCIMALEYAMRTEPWQRLDWDAREEVIEAMGASYKEMSSFFTQKTMEVLQGDPKSHFQIFCALQTAQRAGFSFDTMLVQASPLLSFSQDPSVAAGFEDLLLKSAEKGDWKSYRSLATLLTIEGPADSWFPIIGTLSYLGNDEKAFIGHLLENAIKEPESKVREALEPLLSMEDEPDYAREIAFIKEVFERE